MAPFPMKDPAQPLRDYHAGVWAQLGNGPMTGTARRRNTVAHACWRPSPTVRGGLSPRAACRRRPPRTEPRGHAALHPCEGLPWPPTLLGPQTPEPSPALPLLMGTSTTVSALRPCPPRPSPLRPGVWEGLPREACSAEVWPQESPSGLRAPGAAAPQLRGQTRHPLAQSPVHETHVLDRRACPAQPSPASSCRSDPAR